MDDLHGRSISNRRNEDRDKLCYRLRLNDITPIDCKEPTKYPVSNPIADAVFIRGQGPTEPQVGDVVFNDEKSVLDAVESGWKTEEQTRSWAMVLLDLCFFTGKVTAESNTAQFGMPEGNPHDDDPDHYFGLRLLRAISGKFPWIPIVVHSTMPRKDVSKQYSRDGVAFLARPETDDENAADNLNAIIQRHGLIEDPLGEIVGRSVTLLKLLREARLACLNASSHHILMRGETGTGKELLARYINRHGTNITDRKLHIINSPVLSADLFASELFGIKKGVATSVDFRVGRIEKADGGSIFLDEIKDMIPQVQAGILRVLEDGVVNRIGEDDSSGRVVDVRFLSATNADIDALVDSGEFRLDLLNRLRSGGDIELPPLRDRPDDLPHLATKFVNDALKSNPIALKREIDLSAIEKLAEYRWPGNIRELRTCLFRAVNHHPDVEHLLPEHLVFSINAKVQGYPLSLDRERHVRPIQTANTKPPYSLDEIISILDEFNFDEILVTDLLGRFSMLEAAYAKFAIRYLRSALLATRRMSVANPEGKILYQPAVKLMFGEDNLTGAKAADRVKKLFRIAPKAIVDYMSDPILSEVLDKCASSRRSARDDS